MALTTKIQKQLKQIIHYLSQRTNKCSCYLELIELLKEIEGEITKDRFKILIVDREQELIDEIRNITLKRDTYLFTSAILADAIAEIDRNYDAALLILDSSKAVTLETENFIEKAIEFQLAIGVIVNHNTSQQSLDLDFEQKYRKNISICNSFGDNSNNQDESFLSSLLTKVLAEKELKFKQQIFKASGRFFEQTKKKFWQAIQQRKEIHLVKKNPEQVQQIINQLPNRCNRITQNYFRVFKQNNNQSKLNIVNPFCLDSLMYCIQNTIQDAEVINELEKEKVYLSLVIKKPDYTRAIHLYLVDMCQQFFSTWLTEEWHNIEERYNNGGLKKLQAQLELEINPLVSLCGDIALLRSDIETKFNLDNYICLSALENNSKIPFDYHYTQSTWFRLLVAVGIGSIIFLLTNHLFGFILLFVQIVNLITGQDAKTIRLRQHTKEMKRIVDSRYQYLIRFLADKLVQDIAIALDDLDRNYQEQIETITQQATTKLERVKQEIALDKEQIEELKQTHLKIQTILQNQ